MYEDFSDYEEESLSHKNRLSVKYIVYGIIIVALFFIVYFVFINTKTYHYYEEKLINAAKKYVQENDIVTYKEVYYDNTKLNVTLPSNCANTSGVIQNGNNYLPYLVCSDYESEIIDNDNKYIKLIGEDVILLNKGDNYYELGYTSNEDVTVTGEMGTEEGVYNIYYITSNNEVVTRKIIVIDSSISLNNYPKIELIGESVLNISLNEEYLDSGVIATDSIDKDISSNVIMYGDVNIYKQGEYIINYTVKNSRGYKSSVKRKVIVTNNNSDISIVTELSNSNITNESINIIFNILGTSYSHTILPNNTINYSNNFQYEVKENGKYVFQVVSINGEIEEKEIEIKNIYQGALEGTCNAVIYNDYVEISVNALSNIDIMGYNYYIDDESTGYRVSNEYLKYGVKPSNIYVKVRDIIGNEVKVNCTISNEEKTTYSNPNGYTNTFSGAKLTMPITTALSKKGYTVTDLNLCIYNRVKAVGPGTRYGVMEAGVSLLECTKEMTGYVYSYDHCGAKVVDEGNCKSNPDICGKLGINTKWGTGSSGGCCASGKETCYSGFNCANYVRWAMCNGGMNLCKGGSSGTSLIHQEFFPGADSFEIYYNNVTYKYGNDLTYLGVDNLIHMVQPGDIMRTYRKDDTNGSSEHIVLIVGKDDNYIYFAENGNQIRRYSYSEITNGNNGEKKAFQFALLDNYYANPNNKNDLYK